MKTRLLAELGAVMVFGQARAALRRLVRGPARPDWSWQVELLASGMRAIMMRSKRRGVHWLRAALEVAPVPRPFLSRVRCEDVDAGGVRARWFVPHAAPASPRTIAQKVQLLTRFTVIARPVPGARSPPLSATSGRRCR
jgi:hypothetical protein